MYTSDSAYSRQREEIRANKTETTIFLSIKINAINVSRRFLHALTRVISSIHTVANLEIRPNVLRRETEIDVIDDEWLSNGRYHLSRVVPDRSSSVMLWSIRGWKRPHCCRPLE
jgi:hypothetical protein